MAIVTGAASGICSVVAEELAVRGAHVIVSDVKEDEAAQTADRIRKSGGAADFFAADIADPDASRQLVAFAKEKGGALHLAVNNAGIGGASERTGEYPLDSWRRVIDINLSGVFFGMHFQIPAMLDAWGGAIVNMASILGSVGLQNASAYVAAKHGVLGLKKAAAVEYAQRGICINSIGPAFIDTPLLSKNLDQATLDALPSMHPIGRIGTPEEVSALACFLLSERASFITGSFHLADGGYTAQ